MTQRSAHVAVDPGWGDHGHLGRDFGAHRMVAHTGQSAEELPLWQGTRCERPQRSNSFPQVLGNP